MPKAVPKHLKDLTPDPENRRLHNPRNLGMVVDALHKVGAARSIVIDENNVILAGNGVTEAAAEAGITKVRVIEASGEEIIAVRRSGLTAEQKRALAIYDNRTGELAEWNQEQLRADQAAGLDLQPWFYEDELDRLLNIEPSDGIRTDADPGESANKGIKIFQLIFTPAQYERVKIAVDELVKEHGTGEGPQPVSNAIEWAVLNVGR